MSEINWRNSAARHAAYGPSVPNFTYARWPEDDPDEDPVQWEQDREAERHQSHLDRVHGGSDCDCVF